MTLPGFEGRLGRLAFFWQSIVFSIGFTVAAVALTMFLAIGGGASAGARMMFLLVLLAPVALYGSLSLQVRRLHDIGWPVLPFIGAWFAVSVVDAIVASLLRGHPVNGTIVGTIIELGFALALLFWPGSEQDDWTPPAYQRPTLPPPQTRQRALPGEEPQSREIPVVQHQGFGRRTT